MIFLKQSEHAFDGMDAATTEALRHRLHEIAVACQTLAYEFYHQHGRPIDPSALNPENLKYDLLPPGHRTRRLEAIELAREILAYLRQHLPHALPRELRP